MGATPVPEESWGLSLPPVFNGCLLSELEIYSRAKMAT